MASGRCVVINGDLGSGKSTVATLLAKRLRIRRVSIGDLYRRMAAQRGVSALQLNLHAELDETIDRYVDRLQREIAASGEQLVVDSRLAWYFLTDALKVHLITDLTVAARRVLGRTTPVEEYPTVEQARSHLRSRSESERVRFLTRYGADKTRLRNYDLICDSTRASPPEIVKRIIECLETPQDDRPAPVCHLDPRRILPTTDVPSPDSPQDSAALGVGYTAPRFFAVNGHRHLSLAVRSGQALVQATLVAEAHEEIAGVRCDQYLYTNATPARIGNWELTHAIELPQIAASPPLLRRTER
jgi:predicted cytidylate kinase